MFSSVVQCRKFFCASARLECGFSFENAPTVRCSLTILSLLTQYVRIRRQDKTKLQEDINRVTEWFNRGHVSLNPAKCKIMNIGRLNQGGDKSIESPVSVRDKLNEIYLGI